MFYGQRWPNQSVCRVEMIPMWLFESLQIQTDLGPSSNRTTPFFAIMKGPKVLLATSSISLITHLARNEHQNDTVARAMLRDVHTYERLARYAKERDSGPSPIDGMDWSAVRVYAEYGAREKDNVLTQYFKLPWYKRCVFKFEDEQGQLDYMLKYIACAALK